VGARAIAFKSQPRQDGVPGLSYDGPGWHGGAYFLAVGARGGWALEALHASPVKGKTAVVYGATIAGARRVRFGQVASVRTMAYSQRSGVRFFGAVVPRAALDVPPDEIVAMDRAGRLLGRQHDNDGHGGFGRCDGLWDRAHCARWKGAR
jgi:hypothetical protein